MCGAMWFIKKELKNIHLKQKKKNTKTLNPNNYHFIFVFLFLFLLSHVIPQCSGTSMEQSKLNNLESMVTLILGVMYVQIFY